MSPGPIAARTGRAALGVAVLAFVGCAGPDAPAGEAGASASNGAPATVEEKVVHVYSARHYDVDDRVVAAFEEATGIEVRVVEADSAALLERLAREGEASPADVFFAVDAGRLHHAVEAGIFQPVSSPVLEERIPEHLRHPGGLWFGLTKRARVLVTSTERVEPDAITSYEQLAEPDWKGRVLVRSSSNVYNQSLLGAMVAAHGEADAEVWCQGLVANLARKPQGGDRDQIRAVAANVGDVAVVNSYYLGQMLASDEAADREAAAKVRIVFPNQDGRGTHVNVSGAGVVRGAPHRDHAIRLLEYLTEPEVQAIYAGENKEYPVVAHTPLAPELVEFGEFREDSLSAAVAGSGGQNALRVMDRCGWR